MALKDFALGIGVGSVVGAVSILMLPRHCEARRIAERTACMAEDAICDMMEQMG